MPTSINVNLKSNRQVNFAAILDSYRLREHSARVPVDHDRQVDKSSGHRKVGNISRPANQPFAGCRKTATPCGHVGHLEKFPGPHCVLHDLRLPKIDGLEVLRRIKSDKNTRKIPGADNALSFCLRASLRFIYYPVYTYEYFRNQANRSWIMVSEWKRPMHW